MKSKYYHNIKGDLKGGIYVTQKQLTLTTGGG
jgi:hypothetical protein